MMPGTRTRSSRLRAGAFGLGPGSPMRVTVQRSSNSAASGPCRSSSWIAVRSSLGVVGLSVGRRRTSGLGPPADSRPDDSVRTPRVSPRATASATKRSCTYRQLLATEAKGDKPRLEHEADLNAGPDCLAGVREWMLDDLGR